MLTGDFGTFEKHVAPPYRVSFFDKNFEYKNLTTLKLGFDSVCDDLEKMVITDFIRICISAALIDDSTIHFSHMSHLISHGTLVKPPYPCFTQGKLLDGSWKMTSSDYAFDPESPTAIAMFKAAQTIQQEP